MKTELENIEKMAPAQLFKPKKMDTLLKAIEVEATAEVPDVETSEGRKAITSIAYKVARSKTTIDDLGKEHVGKAKAAIADIDAVRKTSRDFLDALKIAVRKPLTDWEDAEEARIEKLTDKVNVIRELGKHCDDMAKMFTSAAMKMNLEKLRGLKITKAFQEYQDDAINAKNAAVVSLLEAIPVAEDRERQAETERLEEEERVENERIERDQQVAREAVEKADLDSKRELEERDQQEAQDKADQEKRERDTNHKGKVHREAAAAIAKILGSGNVEEAEDVAKRIVKAVVKHQIPHTTINY